MLSARVVRRYKTVEILDCVKCCQPLRVCNGIVYWFISILRSRFCVVSSCSYLLSEMIKKICLRDQLQLLLRLHIIVSWLGEEGDFEVPNCLPSQNLIRSTKLHLTTESAFLPNACYWLYPSLSSVCVYACNNCFIYV